MSLWRHFTALFKREARRPLAMRQPARPATDVPLGMEALDLEAIDRVHRRNNALERAPGLKVSARNSGWFSRAADITVAPIADDETYAARYTRAFQSKDVKDD